MRKKKLVELKKLIEDMKTINIKKMHEPSEFIKSEVYECVLNNGQVIKREKMLKSGNNGSAAIILPVLANNQVILTVEPRVFTKETVGIGIPAGYIENGEQAKQAALRELEEETGYTTNNLIPLGGFYQDMGCSSAFNECFLALNSTKVSEQRLDKDEYIKYFTCYYKEALELIDLGYIKECNAIITLNKAKKYMKGKSK